MKKIINKYLKKELKLSPKQGYDILSESYHEEYNKLLLINDQKLTISFVNDIDINQKVLLDFGCGTGRYWDYLIKRNHKELIACDISQGMLKKLKERFPNGKTHLLQDDKLSFIEDKSIDLIFCNVTLGYLEELSVIFKEWERILSENGVIILTDLHPELIRHGGKRSFKIGNKKISIKNFYHSLEEIRLTIASLNFEITKSEEVVISNEHKPYYEKSNALATFENFKGKPLIFGMFLKKASLS